MLQYDTIWRGFDSNKNTQALVLLSQKCMGKYDFVKTSQEATVDSILFASSCQTVPLRHHFPFLEMWPLFHLIYILFLCCLSHWLRLTAVKPYKSSHARSRTKKTDMQTFSHHWMKCNIQCLFYIKTTCEIYLSLHNLHHCSAVQKYCRALLGFVCSH